MVTTMNSIMFLFIFKPGVLWIIYVKEAWRK